MSVQLAKAHKDALSEKLADSLVSPLPQVTARRMHGAVSLPGKATAIIGMRRSGKTWYLHQLRQERLASGLPRIRVPYINFEDERLAGLRGEHLGFVLDEYGRRAAGTGVQGPVTWCFDEIQVVPGWERFIRRLLDSGQMEVLVSGSSSDLLSREIATALRGRAWAVPLYPFSFEETLRHQGKKVFGDPLNLGRAERSELERTFLDWLAVGGFPEVQGLEPGTRRQLLQDYVDVAMLRDIVERHRISNITGLRWLVRHLLGNAASLFSVEKFHAALKSQGVAIGRDTLHQLLGYCEDCFLVRLVWMESNSERQRMVNPRKVYPIDHGLIPIYDRSGRSNQGHALESAVLIELERRRCSVTYVRTQASHEVDFLARGPAGEQELIQVCADASEPATANRELRALMAAGEMYPSARQRLLTLTRDGAPSEVPAGVVVQPAYEWMLTT